MHDAPEDADLRLALLLVWALHEEAERLAQDAEPGAPTDPARALDMEP